MHPDIERPELRVVEAGLEHAAEPFGQTDRADIAGRDQAHDPAPSQGAVGEVAAGDGRLGGDAASLGLGIERPADLGLGPVFGMVDTDDAEGRVGLPVGDHPAPVAAKRPLPDDSGEMLEARGGVARAAHEARPPGGLEAGMGFEVSGLRQTQAEPVCHEFRHSEIDAHRALPVPGPARDPDRPGAAAARLSAGLRSRPGGSPPAPPKPGMPPPPPSWDRAASISAFEGPPLPPKRPPIWRIMFLPPILPIFFIMSDICRCIFRSLLSSETSRPAPFAMRFFRDAWRICGFARSFFVIELMRATWRRTMPSSMPASAICFCIFPTPGSMPMMPSIPPIFCICSSWRLRSFMLN